MVSKREAVRLYKAGLTMQQVADRLGCTPQNIRLILIAVKCPRRPKGRRTHPRPICSCGKPCKELRNTSCSHKCDRRLRHWWTVPRKAA